MEASTATETNRPPWGGFQTFWNFIKQLHEDRPVPQILDRAVMAGRGGSTRTELYAALRFLDLMDADKKPTQALLDLVENPTPANLRPLIEEHYGPVIALDLTTATPNQVQDRLSEMGATPSIVPRTRTFFLKAAEEVGIEIGKTLQTAPSPPTRRKATRKSRKTAAEDIPEMPPTPPADPLQSLHPAIITLVKSLPEFADPAEKPVFASAERKAWFDYAKATFNLIYSRPDGDTGAEGTSDA
ncbi:MAG: hypothetical protein JSS97_02370 [Actinobacteria bacterium]|nr:hypothetical protein [Actinomycetota bacterium]